MSQSRLTVVINLIEAAKYGPSFLADVSCFQVYWTLGPDL